jgi:hypothetical protein
MYTIVYLTMEDSLTTYRVDSKEKLDELIKKLIEEEELDPRDGLFEKIFSSRVVIFEGSLIPRRVKVNVTTEVVVE